LTVTTVGTPTRAVTGTLPGGVTFVDNLDGSGYAERDAGGGDRRLVRAYVHRGERRAAGWDAGLHLERQLVATSAGGHERAAAMFTVGTPGSFTVTTGGFPLPTLVSVRVSEPRRVQSWPW
jgi:hypothetical protein